MEEVWKDVVGYEGYYQVSNLGVVRSVYPNGTVRRILKQAKNKQGYKIATLYKDKKTKTFYVHRLVTYAFIGVSDLTVDHINHNIEDNSVGNLRYLTRSENCKEAHIWRINNGLQRPDYSCCCSFIKPHHSKFHARMEYHAKTKIGTIRGVLMIGAFESIQDAENALIEFIQYPEETLKKYRQKPFKQVFDKFKKFVELSATRVT